jgi:2-dehydropantoate 2-reductase
LTLLQCRPSGEGQLHHTSNHIRVDLVIVGAGAIGGLTGAHLARAGHRVVLVERDREHVDAIRRDGLTISGSAEFTVRVPVHTPDDVAGALLGMPVTAVILAVKTLHTREALAPIAPLLSRDGFVLSMQNGLEEEVIAGLVGRHRTLAAFLTFGGYYDGPGRVVYSGPASLRIGELDGRITERVRNLARVLSDFHPTSPSDNILGCRWGKLILGAIYFATATVDADVVDIIRRQEARQALAALATEAATVAQTLGVRVEPVDGFDPLAVRLDGDPHAAEAAWNAQVEYWQRGLANRTGVWRDLAVRGRKTEAGPILGALIAAADRVRVPVPRTRALAALIGEIEDGRRAMGWDNLEEISRAG